VTNSRYTVWRWGERAPSLGDSEELEGQGNTNPRALQEKEEHTRELEEGGQSSENSCVHEEGSQHAPQMVCTTSLAHSE
jgi:hypothetical protein